MMTPLQQTVGDMFGLQALVTALQNVVQAVNTLNTTLSGLLTPISDPNGTN